MFNIFKKKVKSKRLMDRTQYIETLIKIIKINNDQRWTPYFINLRNGGSLPGGGAGSLNDWGPSYSDDFQNSWYSDLYGIMRYLFDNKLFPEDLKGYEPIRNSNKVRILRCTECDGRYQHPSRFESHIALNFYKEKVSIFKQNKELPEILEPNKSYMTPSTIIYRNSLKNEYDRLGIIIYNFIEAQYICGHCGKERTGTEHEIFEITRAKLKRVK